MRLLPNPTSGAEVAGHRTETLDVAVIDGIASRGPDYALGITIAYLAIIARLKYLPSADDSMFVWADLVFVAVGLLAGWTLNSHVMEVRLELGDPPALLVSERWVGRPRKTRRTPLPGVAWVRVSQDAECALMIELGTRSYMTTPLPGLSWPRHDVAAATATCTRIATALRVEDKGLLHFP